MHSSKRSVASDFTSIKSRIGSDHRERNTNFLSRHSQTSVMRFRSIHSALAFAIGCLPSALGQRSQAANSTVFGPELNALRTLSVGFVRHVLSPLQHKTLTKIRSSPRLRATRCIRSLGDLDSCKSSDPPSDSHHLIHLKHSSPSSTKSRLQSSPRKST